MPYIGTLVLVSHDHSWLVFYEHQNLTLFSFDGVEFKNKIEKFRQHAGVAKLRIEAKFRVESTDRFLQNTSVDFPKKLWTSNIWS